MKVEFELSRIQQLQKLRAVTFKKTFGTFGLSKIECKNVMVFLKNGSCRKNLFETFVTGVKQVVSKKTAIEWLGMSLVLFLSGVF